MAVRCRELQLICSIGQTRKENKTQRFSEWRAKRDCEPFRMARKSANRRRCAQRRRANRRCCAQRGARIEIAHIYIYIHRAVCRHTYIYKNKNMYVNVHICMLTVGATTCQHPCRSGLSSPNSSVNPNCDGRPRK